MNLVVDQGNTLTKVALFEGEELIDLRSMPSLSPNAIQELTKNATIGRAIFSSVHQKGDNDFEILKSIVPNSLNLDARTPLPFTNLYATPESLGKDRIAAVAGAIARYPNACLMVIDAGTAITYELVTQNSCYVGGNIAPGMQMRFKALHHFTGKLPLCKSQNRTESIGNTTQTAIIAGVQQGMVFEIEGYMEYFGKQYAGLKTILTGGDSEFFAKRVKYPIFVHQNLVLEGLNRILNHNV